jgi:hypothetical protein
VVVLSVLTGTLAAMARDLPPQLHDLAQLQCGVVSRAQILQAGLSKDVIASRLGRGSWQRMYPGTFAVFSGEPSRTAQMWAAVLACGPGAMLSHQTAAEAWGLIDTASSLIHVTLPVLRRIRKKPGIVVHSSARAHQAVHPAKTPPITRIEETILDLWDAAPTLEDAFNWVARGVGARRTTQAKLREAVARRTRIRWRPRLTELLSEDAAGLHSVLEYRYVRDVERPHGLPAGTRQAHARRGGRNEYRDVLYDAYDTAIELDGRAAHPGDTRWRDIRRDNAAAAAGITTLRYGWLEITTAPCLVAAEVAMVLAARGYTGAKPCSDRCPVRGVAQRRRPSA